MHVLGWIFIILGLIGSGVMFIVYQFAQSMGKGEAITVVVPMLLAIVGIVIVFSKKRR